MVGVLPLAHQFGEPGAALRSVAVGDQMLDRGIDPCRHRRRAEPQVGETHDLALAHRDAADDLGQIFSGADADQKLLDFAEIPGGREPLHVGRELAQRLDIGREPGKAVGGALLAIERARNGAAVAHHPLGNRPARVGEQRLDGVDRLVQRRDQFVLGGLGGCGKRHNRAPMTLFGRSRTTAKLTRAVHKKPIVCPPRRQRQKH